MARTYRDPLGVPHVRAASVSDLARGQGRVTARDRTWQLEWLRRRATGTVAEALGAGATGWDVFARRACLAGTARRAAAALEPETAAFVAAYVEGVNAGLDPDCPELRRLDLAPTPWEPWTPLAVFLAQHVLFAAMPSKLWLHRAREVLGDEAELLSAEGPHPSGSNAWAVGPARTASGRPLIGGDPHRTLEHPNVYAQVRLACEDPDDAFDVVGLAFPGVPGVAHFAHAGGVAWAITNAMGDYQDVFRETLRRRDGRVEALGPDGWERAASHRETVAVRDGEPVDVEVVRTPRGCVFDGSVADGVGLSLRTASDELGDLGFDALLPLLRARTVDDVDRALDRWVEPVNNVVVADSTGAVRYRVAGRVPLRDDANRRGVVAADDPAAAWRGWVDPLPAHDVPADGQVVTANERRGPESDAIGAAFAPPHRARRIAALLSGRSELDAADFAEVHADTLLPTYDAVRALLLATPAEPRGLPALTAILDWDGRMDAGSRGAAAFAAWRGALVRRIAAAPRLAPLTEPSGHPALLEPWHDLTTRVAQALDTLLAHGAPFGLDLAALAAEALAEASERLEQTSTWGEVHVLRVVHAFETTLSPHPALELPDVGVSGDHDCVRCAGSVPGVTDACVRGSVARYVWDLADRTAGGWVVPLGASGDPRSPHHHDQLGLWAEARLAPIVTAWDLLAEET
ncbi:penicillin acylase family protein [Nocardioides sp. SYSU D00038]|uniref:penicillin acylase family protein n=1 Tax=Nocardioides sp. SYSU D00038 TaxID=2812554 RepID=UPI001967C5E3|nr:penicillin acylase family protein [Nocardioides sp. SYSU D00038]